MVDVAGGVIDDEHGDARLEGMLDFLRETAGPVRGDDVSANRVAVVGDVAEQGGDAAVLDDFQDADGAVEIAFRLVDVRIAPARIGQQRAVFHPVAADEAVGVVIDGADLQRTGQTVHHGAGEGAHGGVDRLVEGVFRPFVPVIGVADELRTRVGVRGGEDEAVVKFLPELLRDALLEFLEHELMDAAEIEGHESEGLAVAFDDEDLDVEIVVHAFVGAFVEITCETDAGRRRDDFLCVADVEHDFLVVGG